LLTVAAAVIASAALHAAPESKPAESSAADTSAERFSTESLRGRVVWLADALKQRYDIELDADVEHAMCALATDDGRLLPLVKDDRGRGFWLDERIRNIEVELLVRRFHDSPLIQVLRVYTLKPDGRYEFDYWCDTCSIPMFELKQCECCQGPIRVRERRVEEGAD
jgi:hypothetical protein